MSSRTIKDSSYSSIEPKNTAKLRPGYTPKFSEDSMVKPKR